VTYESVEQQILFPLTSSAEDSHANRTASRGRERHQKTSATYGESLPALFANCGQDGCWQRTYQDCSPLSLDGSSVEFCGTWPRSGIAWNGKAYRRQPLVPLTVETESSLWPTPYGLSANQGQGDGEFGKAIRNSVRWPTPKEQDSRCASWDRGKSNLGEVVAGMNPGGQLNPTWVEWLMGFPLGWTDLDA